jgi:hypothetical protein
MKTKLVKHRRVKPFGEALGNFIYDYCPVLTNEEMGLLFQIARNHKAFIMIVEKKTWLLDKHVLDGTGYFMKASQRWKTKHNEMRVKK